MAFMEKENTFVKMYDKWLNDTANIHLEDGSKQVCRLKQTCTPTGAARMMMMIAFITFKSSLVPLFEGL